MTVWKCAPWWLASIACLPALALAKPADTAEVPVGRYSIAVAAPRPEQINPLKALVTLHFPQRQVRTVGDALHYLLRPSGYQLAEADASDPAVPILLTQPLPEVQRHLGPCTLQTALMTLAGPVYRLVVDFPHRRVSFELTAQYRALVRVPDATQASETSGNAALR
jgi:type IV pili sensor histidine kinase/response regulator